MTFYLVRHTSLQLQDNLCYGQSDIAVSENYDFEKTIVFSKLDHLNKSKLNVYTSPSKRCKSLAIDYHDKYQIDPRLMEMNFGDWENKYWKDIPLEDSKAWTSDFVNERTPNGESFVDLYERCVPFINDMLVTGDSKENVIFTHAGVIRSLLCFSLVLPLQYAFRLKIDYNSVSKISFKNNIFSIDYINR